MHCRGVWYTPDYELRLLLFGHLLLFGRLQNAPTQRDAKRDVIFCPFYSIYCRGVWYTPDYELYLLLFGRLQHIPSYRWLSYTTSCKKRCNIQSFLCYAL